MAGLIAEITEVKSIAGLWCGDSQKELLSGCVQGEPEGFKQDKREKGREGRET